MKKIHKFNCKCASCKSKRGEFSGKNNPRYIDGRSLSIKTIYCIYGCGEKVSIYGNRCHSCASKKSLHKNNCNCFICRAIGGENKGIKSPNYGNKKPKRIFYCKYNCGKEVSGMGRGCCSCSQKEYLKSPMNHWNYKDGRTDLRDRIRKLEEYRIWRDKIFEDNNFICQECFKKGGDLEVHHIKPFVIILIEFLQIYNQFSPVEDKEALVRLSISYEPFWNIHNGIVLCTDCHNKTKRGCHFLMERK